jgi:hypothetical protein
MHWQKSRQVTNVGNLDTTFEEVSGGHGYSVTLPFSQVPSEKRLMAFGQTIWVGWTGEDVPSLELKHYVVTLQSLHIRDSLTGRWSLYGYVNEEALGSLLTGEIQANNEAYMKVDDGQTIRFNPAPSWDVYTVPGQPLRVAFRASAWTKFGKTGGSEFLGTAEGIWMTPPASVMLKSTAKLFVGHEDDVDKECREPCYSVTVNINPG